MFRKPISIRFLAFITICMMLFMISCATFVRNSYRSLSTAGETYDATMKSAADLYRKGVIDDEQKAKIVEIAIKYKMSYDIAVDALDAYNETSSVEAKDRYMKAFAEFTPILQELIELVQEFKKSDTSSDSTS